MRRSYVTTQVDRLKAEDDQKKAYFRDMFDDLEKVATPLKNGVQEFVASWEH
jgi:hypothetical protein